MINRIIEYIHRPNKTEVGVETNTNDTYLKLPRELEKLKSEIFFINKDNDFIVRSNKEDELLDSQKNVKVSLYAKKYSSGEKEYRLTKLGTVRKRFNIECGDELVFRREIGSMNRIPSLEIHKFSKVLFYALKNGNEYQIVYPEKIKNWNSDKTTAIEILYHGQESQLVISFNEAKRARKDSPNDTRYYTVELNGTLLKQQTYCLSFETNRPTLREYNKWEYNEIKIEQI